VEEACFRDCKEIFAGCTLIKPYTAFFGSSCNVFENIVFGIVLIFGFSYNENIRILSRNYADQMPIHCQWYQSSFCEHLV
jgi:hypothetical protein